MKFRAKLRIESRLPNMRAKVGMFHTNLRWEIIQAFDPIEQFAWGHRFGEWDVSGHQVRSLDWDTYEDWQVWGPGVRAYLREQTNQ